MELFISLAIKLRSKLNIQMRKKTISDKEPQLPFKLEKLLCCCNVAQYLEGSVSIDLPRKTRRIADDKENEAILRRS